MSARHLVVPVFLLACLLLGGSSQNPQFNALLQLAGVAIIAVAAIKGARDPLPRDAHRLGALVMLTIGLVAIHLLPLPSAIWASLPGRKLVGDGLDILGLRPGWQPLSLAPYETLSTVLFLLPPLAVLAGMFLLRAYSRTAIAMTFLIAAALGLALGILQAGSPGDSQSQFYLQAEFNAGTPSGFFANPNHMATLLLVVLPFVAALAGEGAKRGRTGLASWALAGIAAVTVVGGLFFNGSLAGLALLVPVLLASAAMLFRFPAWVGRVLPGLSIAGVATVGIFVISPEGRAFLERNTGSSYTTRAEFARTSLAVARDYAPVGSGIGTFARVYAMEEDQRTLDPTVFVNHAHDDYIELWVEAGVPGLILILLFLAWWIAAVARMLRSPASDLFARAGAIGSGAILAHSFVDFPLRNSAIATSFAVCVALIPLSRRIARGETDLRPTRHVVIG